MERPWIEARRSKRSAIEEKYRRTGALTPILWLSAADFAVYGLAEAPPTWEDATWD